MTSFVPGGLLAVCLCLASVAVCQLVAPVAPIVDPLAHGAGAKTNVSVQPQIYAPRAEEEFVIINARNVFDPARRPVADPAQAGTNDTGLPDLSLVGVAVGANTSVALLKTPDMQAAMTLRVGQSIGGWTLEQVARDSVVFRVGGARFTLKLRAAKGVLQPPLNDVPVPAVTGQPDR